MNERRLLMLTIIGLLAGTIFGLFFKSIEAFTHKKVYTLLLNVDYFPVLKDLELSEWVELAFHLIVSVLLTTILFISFKRYGCERHIVSYMIINVVIGILLYGTTVMSDRTPALLDAVAWLYWLIGHLLFGFVQGWLIKQMMSSH